MSFLQDYAVSVSFFAFPNIKKAAKFAASIASAKAKSVLVSEGFASPWPSNYGGALPLDPATFFRCTQQLNKVNIWLTHAHKNLLSPCALALAPIALLGSDS